MTITPQHAKTIKAIVNAHRDWVDAVSLKNDMEANIALLTLTHTLEDFRASCPHCGALMTALYSHYDGTYSPTLATHTLQGCSKCGAVTLTYTPGR